MDLMFIPIHVNVKAVRLLLAYGAGLIILYCRQSALGCPLEIIDLLIAEPLMRQI